MDIQLTYACTQTSVALLEQHSESFDIWSANILDLHGG